MSYPADPLDLVVELAPGADPSANPDSVAWTDISRYVRQSTPVRISRGRSSPLADTVPSECSLELDNADGRFTPRNPIGAYYPGLQRGTPLRVRLRQAYDLFGRTVDPWGATLNANPYFEVDAAGWFVNAGEGSIVRSTAQAHEGVASLLLTPDGVGTQAVARSVATTGISPGQVLRGSAWLRCAVARSVTLRIDWRNSSGTFLSSSTVAISVAANTWTFFEVVATAPALTAQAGLAVLMAGTPLASHLLYVDEATLTPEAGGWGTADSGEAWTTSGASASDYFVAGGAGKHSLATVNTLRTSLMDVGVTTQRVSVDVTLPVVPTGAGYTLWVVARATDLSNYYVARLDVVAGGGVFLVLTKRTGGTLSASLAVSGTIGTHAAGQTWRVVFEAAGSQLRTTAWRPAVDSNPGWLLSATDTSLTAGTQVGVLTRAETGNTNGTQVVSFSNVDVSSTRFTGYVDSWPPRWDPSGRLKWAPITARGTLKRIATAGEATRSALYRYYTEQQRLNMSAYWPLEDGSQSTEAASTVPGVAPLAQSTQVRFGQASPPGGVGTMVDVSGAYLHGRIPAEYATDWRVECVVAHEAVPTASVRVLSWLCPGTIQRWDLNTTPSGFQLVGLTAVSGGSTVISISTGVIAQPGRLHHLRVDVTLSGTTNTADVYVDGVLAGSGSLGSSLTVQPTVLRINPDSAQDNVPAVGHVAVWSASPLPATTSAAAALGNLGEFAHVRIEAVCAERGVPYAPVLGTSVSSERMGPRPSGSLVSLLREAEATDGGILYELTTGHLSYRRRLTLYNQPVSLALDYALRHIAQPFEPSDDDAQLRNDVTARRPSGSETRVADDAHIAAVGRYEASLSVNPETDAQLEQTAAWDVHRGTAAEQRFDTIALRMTAGSPVVDGWLACDIGSRMTVANVPADLTPDVVDVILAGYTEAFQLPAGWQVETVCEPASAWTIGKLDDLAVGRLDTAGSQLATGNSSAQIRGDALNRAVVADGGDVALFAVGARVVLHDSSGRRKEPTVFTITAITGPSFGVWDMLLSPLPAALVRGNFTGDFDSVRRVDQTALSVATTAGPVWTANPADLPFDVNVGGERMTVTAISGTSSPQTFTVVRSVNGVRKHHAAGAGVRLWQPLILGY